MIYSYEEALELAAREAPCVCTPPYYGEGGREDPMCQHHTVVFVIEELYGKH